MATRKCLEMARRYTINHLIFLTHNISYCENAIAIFFFISLLPTAMIDRILLGCDGRMSVTVPSPPLTVRLQNPHMFCQLAALARRRRRRERVLRSICSLASEAFTIPLTRTFVARITLNNRWRSCYS